MMPGNFWMPVPLENIERVFLDTFEYRLHIIKIRATGKGAVAHVYDGPVEVFAVCNTDIELALRDAKRWVDEQDEVAPV
ncbi:MAG: hypothetical protein R3E79_54465 [Caldilineaceae bacterium]